MRLIDEAVAAGEARAVDSRVTAFAIIGMCNWTAWWFVPDGELTAATVADMMHRLAGSAGIYARNLLERHLRDAQTLRHHGLVCEGRFETAGQVYLGVPPEFMLVAF